MKKFDPRKVFLDMTHKQCWDAGLAEGERRFAKGLKRWLQSSHWKFDSREIKVLMDWIGRRSKRAKRGKG